MDSYWIQSRKHNKYKKKRHFNSEGVAGKQVSINAYLSWYYNLYSKLARAELEEEKKVIHRRIKTWPLERLKDEGYVILDCKAKHYGKLLGDDIIKFSQGSRHLPFTRFMNGDIISLSQNDPLEYKNPEGIVYEKTSKYITAVFKRIPKDLFSGSWRLDKGTNTIAYERQIEALKCFCGNYHDLPVWLPPLIIPSAIHRFNESEKSQIPITSRILTELMNAAGYDPSIQMLQSLYDASSKMRETRNTFAVNKCIKTLIKEREDKNSKALNESQLKSIEIGLKSAFLIIRGPPGTGKTVTASNLIKAWKLMNPNEGPVLATAQSNVAVDQLLTECSKIGLKAVRTGAPVRVSPELLNCTLDAQTLKHPRIQELNKLQANVLYLKENLKNMKGMQIGLAHRDMSVLQKQADRLTDDIAHEVVAESDVICSTCVGSGCDLLKNIKFGLIVLDEATQCTEPESLIPLSKCRLNAQVVMIGDQQQLPPTVLCQEEKSRRILGTSLFDRLLSLVSYFENHENNKKEENNIMDKHRYESSFMLLKDLINGINTTMLMVQYRMHPSIAMWPSWRFYEDKLINGIDRTHRRPPKGIKWPIDISFAETRNQISEEMLQPVLFIDCSMGTEMVDASMSKKNVVEIEVVLKIIKQLYQDTNPEDQELAYEDIGIISPYVAQVRAITNRLKTLNIPVSYTTALESIQNSTISSGLEVRTVDGFQGREKELIILSTVRSNTNGEMGFLNDFRRMNVALTRAKRGLIVIGHRQTLECSELWDSWIYFAECENIIRDGFEFL